MVDRVTPLKAKKPMAPRVTDINLEKLALQQILEGLKQTNEGLSQTNKFLHELNTTVQDMRAKIVALETHNLAAKYEELNTRLKAVEAEDMRVSGARDLRRTLIGQIPWVVTVVVGAIGWYFQIHVQGAHK